MSSRASSDGDRRLKVWVDEEGKRVSLLVLIGDLRHIGCARLNEDHGDMQMDFDIAGNGMDANFEFDVGNPVDAQMGSRAATPTPAKRIANTPGRKKVRLSYAVCFDSHQLIAIEEPQQGYSHCEQ